MITTQRQLAALRGQGGNERARDTYYDWPDRKLTLSGRELRLRLIEAEGLRQALLTYKEPAIESASGSKPEHETKVENPSAVDIMLRGLGLDAVLTARREMRCERGGRGSR
jgi:adenylate cyclase class 2